MAKGKTTVRTDRFLTLRLELGLPALGLPALGLLALGLLALGCGTSTTDASNTAGTGSALDALNPEVDWTALRLVYPTMYSAYDGEHLFQVPVYADDVAIGLEGWQAVPADAVSFAEWRSSDGTQIGALVTIEKPVDVITIAASAVRVGGTAELRVTSATPEEWEMGRKRYAEGAPFNLESFRANSQIDFNDYEVDLQSGEIRITNPDAEAFGNPTDLRCDTCHTEGADSFQVQHTPTQAARFSDDELIRIFTEGTKPEGVGFRVLPIDYQPLYAYFHTWDTTEAEVRGLVVYLRSLAPKGQGDILLPNGDLAFPDPAF